MGLDQYFYRRKKGEELKPDTEEELYLRKANHIRKWIVDNTDYNDDDDCRPFVLTKDKLEQLFQACNTVLADKKQADTVMPTSSGFFFGSTDYNDWYFSVVEEVLDVINGWLSDVDFDTEEIVYYEWW